MNRRRRRGISLIHDAPEARRASKLPSHRQKADAGLTGDEAYKLDRTSELRPIYHLAGHQRTMRGWLAEGLLVLPRWKLRRVPALR
ncbi:MAG TPA: hypothetical protein VE820_13750, partial [Sphingomicrobium sp.]|nr:hypothetical protein [Sphingomicrobium sp.]